MAKGLEEANIDKDDERSVAGVVEGKETGWNFSCLWGLVDRFDDVAPSPKVGHGGQA